MGAAERFARFIRQELLAGAGDLVGGLLARGDLKDVRALRAMLARVKPDNPAYAAGYTQALGDVLAAFDSEKTHLETLESAIERARAHVVRLYKDGKTVADIERLYPAMGLSWVLGSLAEAGVIEHA